MDIFQKAFHRERKKLSQRGGRPINKLAVTGGSGFPEYALHFSSARKFYETGDLSNSLRSINKAIELSPVDDWKQYAFKANVLGESGRYQEAIHAFEKAIEINSEDIKVYALYHQIGDCYMFLENSEKALEFYSYSIDLKKQYPDSPHDKDIEGIENGVLLGREFIHMYLNRGNAYFNLKQFDEAENDCLRALEINPDYTNACLLLFYIYCSTSQEKKGVEFLKKAIDLGHPTAKKIMNELYIAHRAKINNLTDEERTALEECLNATFVLHDLEEGKRLSQNLINKGINDLLPHLCLATIYEAEKNWKECEDIAKAGLKFKGGDSMFLNMVGVAICNQGADRIPEGLEYLEKGTLAGDERCVENYKIWKSADNNY